MIETTNPEIDVVELMARVRAEAARIRQRPSEAGSSAGNGHSVGLPMIAVLRPPPPMPSIRAVNAKRERLLQILANARAKIQVSRHVPKVLRRLFRKQGAYNELILESVSSGVKTTAELSNRVAELTAAIELQNRWLHSLADHQMGNGSWMRSVASTLSRHMTDLTAQTSRIEEITSEDDRISERVENLSSKAAHMEVGLQELISAAEGTNARMTEFETSLDTGLRTTIRDISSMTERIQSQANPFFAMAQDSRTEIALGAERLRALQAEVDLIRHGQLLSLQRDLERAGEHLRNLQAEVDSVRVELPDLRRGGEQPGHLRALETEVEAMRTQLLPTLRDDLERSGEHLRNLQSDTERHLADLRQLRDQLAAAIIDRANLQQALARIEERQTADSTFIKGELSLQRTTLARATPVVSKGRARKSSGSEIIEHSGHDSHRLDAFYLSFENRFRGTRSDIKSRITVYLPYLARAGAGTADRPIVDLGCGRGEWLELLKERHLQAHGVDVNTCMVELCTERLLDVTEIDALEYLRSLPDNCVGGVTGFHIIEHLPFEMLVDLLSETRRVLQPAGIVIFESPNCKNLVVGACNFNIDPTHRNPVFPETAEFMLKEQGFTRTKLKYLSPVERHLKDSDTGSPVMNQMLYGPQDFAVIAYKPHS